MSGFTFESLFNQDKKTNKSENENKVNKKVSSFSDSVNATLLNTINNINNKNSNNSKPPNTNNVINPLFQNNPPQGINNNPMFNPFGFQFPYFIPNQSMVNPYLMNDSKILQTKLQNTNNNILYKQENFSTGSSSNAKIEVNHVVNDNYSSLDTLLGKKHQITPVEMKNGYEVTFISKPDFSKEEINKADDKFKFFYNKFVPVESGKSYISYVENCYKACSSTEELIFMEKHLNSLLNKPEAKKQGFYKKNWNNHQIPKLKQNIVNNKPEVIKIKNIQIEESTIKEQIDLKSIRKQKYDEEQRLFEQRKLLENKKNNFLLRSTTNNEEKKGFIGTNTNLEKGFLRLKDIPEPSQVRPQHILEKSLKLMVKKWKEKSGEYIYFEEQFKSIRQDITIQSIKNEFTVRVYETNARIALEMSDLDQFNQCQSQLIKLYKEGIKGNQSEFLAYRILYNSFVQPQYVIEDLLKEVYYSPLYYQSEIQHALSILKNMNTKNYKNIYKLYQSAPNMGKLLINPFLPRLRIKTLQVLFQGYYTEMSLDELINKICFNTKDELLQFLTENSKYNNNI